MVNNMINLKFNMELDKTRYLSYMLKEATIRVKLGAFKFNNSDKASHPKLLQFFLIFMKVLRIKKLI